VPPGQELKAEYDVLIERALAGETLRDIRVTRRRKDGVLVDISFDAAAIREAGQVKAIAYALGTSLSATSSKASCAIRKSSMPSASSPAVWRTTSTTC
jgi:hypothetical protein